VMSLRGRKLTQRQAEFRIQRIHKFIGIRIR
jgi:hypothetical protein